MPVQEYTISKLHFLIEKWLLWVTSIKFLSPIIKQNYILFFLIVIIVQNHNLLKFLSNQLLERIISCRYVLVSNKHHFFKTYIFKKIVYLWNSMFNFDIIIPHKPLKITTYHILSKIANWCTKFNFVWIWLYVIMINFIFLHKCHW